MATDLCECPKCKSDNLEFGDYEFDTQIWQPRACLNCGFEFQAVYEFSYNGTGDGNCDVLDKDGNTTTNNAELLKELI